MTMASLAHTLSLVPPSKSLFPKTNFPRGRPKLTIVSTTMTRGTYPMTDDQKARKQTMKIFEEAYMSCRKNPMEGVPFTEEQMIDAIKKSLTRFTLPVPEVEAVTEVTAVREVTEVAEVSTGKEAVAWAEPIKEIGRLSIEHDRLYLPGDVVNGVVCMVSPNVASVDIGEKFMAMLHLEEATIVPVDDMFEAGIYPGLCDEFIITGLDRRREHYIVSIKELLFDLAWDRIEQLQAENATIFGQVIDENTGGVIVMVEGLEGFLPFSQIAARDATVDDLMGKDLALKIMEVDKNLPRLVLSNRKAREDNQGQLGIGSVVTGTVESIKPYGAFIDIGGRTGLLHVSQISHDRVADISTVLQPGDTLKAMVLSHDRERGRISLTTKKLEPTPGDMIINPKLVFEKADEMARIFRQKNAQIEAMDRADILRFHPGGGLSTSSDGILGLLASDSIEDDIDFSTPRDEKL